jgi:hypothetical protein
MENAEKSSGETKRRRTALVPGACKRHSSPRFHMPELGWVRGYSGVKRRGSIKRQRIVVNSRDGLREHRARRPESLNVDASIRPIPRQIRLHHAVMRSIAPAASRKPQRRCSSQRKQRRDQRKAEHQQKRCREETRHAIRLTHFRARRSTLSRKATPIRLWKTLSRGSPSRKRPNPNIRKQIAAKTKCPFYPAQPAILILMIKSRRPTPQRRGSFCFSVSLCSTSAPSVLFFSSLRQP